MNDLIIYETEESDRYEARAFANGLKHSKVVYRDPTTGWPYDYKQKAHNEIRRAAIFGAAASGGLSNSRNSPEAAAGDAEFSPPKQRRKPRPAGHS